MCISLFHLDIIITVVTSRGKTSGFVSLDSGAMLLGFKSCNFNIVMHFTLCGLHVQSSHIYCTKAQHDVKRNIKYSYTSYSNDGRKDMNAIINKLMN